jgi:hypothetical protein
MPKGIPNPKPFGGRGDHDNNGTTGGAHAAVEEKAAPLAPFPPTPMDDIGHTPAVTAKIEAAKPKLVPVRLLRNYRPMTSVFEVVGYHKEPIIRKRSDGKMVTIEEGGFFKETDDDGAIVGAPPAMVGTGFGDRLNVGTVVRLPRDEAKRARDEKIGEYELDD